MKFGGFTRQETPTPLAPPDVEENVIMNLKQRVFLFEKEVADLKRQLKGQPGLDEKFMLTLIEESTKQAFKDLLMEPLELGRNYQLTKCDNHK